MANKILNMIFKATDDVSGTLQDIEGGEGRGGIGGIEEALKGMINPGAMATAAIAGLGVAVVATFSKYQEYVKDVGDLNAMIGGTMEETSMLTKFMKDFEISADAMSGTMMALARNGFDPSIEGLIAIRDRLAEASTEQERLTLAATLGGEQFVTKFLPAIEAVGEGLDDYAENFDKSLVVTEEMRQEQIKMEAAIAAVNAEWTTLALNFGSTVAPAVLSLTEVWTELLFIQKMSLSEFIDWRIEESEWRKTLELSEEAIDGWAAGLLLASDAAEEVTDTTVDLEDVTKFLGIALNIQADGFSWATVKAWEHVAALIADKEAADALASGLRNLAPLLSMATGGSAMWAEAGVDPYVAAGGYGGGTDVVRGWQLFEWSTQADRDWAAANPKGGFQHGGEFTIGGLGGPDSQLVQFMGTPGEPVTVGEGDDKLDDVIAELRRFTNTFPTVMRDTMARV